MNCELMVIIELFEHKRTRASEWEREANRYRKKRVILWPFNEESSTGMKMKLFSSFLLLLLLFLLFSLIDFNATLQVASIFHLLFSPRLSFHTDTTADATQNAVFRVNCCKLLKHRLNGGILLRVSAKKRAKKKKKKSKLYTRLFMAS